MLNKQKMKVTMRISISKNTKYSFYFAEILISDSLDARLRVEQFVNGTQNLKFDSANQKPYIIYFLNSNELANRDQH